VDQAGARHSLSPMVADGGAVMGTECSNAKLVCWSILLIHGNFTRTLGIRNWESEQNGTAPGNGL
jgi:hypothetical protein